MSLLLSSGEMSPEGDSRRRFPLRPGIQWVKGERLEAQDYQRYWYQARIVAVDNENPAVLIHFDHWNQRYDEWIDMDSDRLRPGTRRSDRAGVLRHGETIFQSGDTVLAKWTDGKMYPANVENVTADGSYVLLFAAGSKRTVPPIDVKPIPEQMSREFSSPVSLNLKIATNDGSEKMIGKPVDTMDGDCSSGNRSVDGGKEQSTATSSPSNQRRPSKLIISGSLFSKKKAKAQSKHSAKSIQSTTPISPTSVMLAKMENHVNVVENGRLAEVKITKIDTPRGILGKPGGAGVSRIGTRSTCSVDPRRSFEGKLRDAEEKKKMVFCDGLKLGQQLVSPSATRGGTGSGDMCVAQIKGKTSGAVGDMIVDPGKVAQFDSMETDVASAGAAVGKTMAEGSKDVGASEVDGAGDELLLNSLLSGGSTYCASRLMIPKESGLSDTRSPGSMAHSETSRRTGSTSISLSTGEMTKLHSDGVSRQLTAEHGTVLDEVEFREATPSAGDASVRKTEGGKRCGQSPLETIVVEGKRLKVSKYIKALSTSSEVDTIPTPLPSRQHQQHSSAFPTCRPTPQAAATVPALPAKAFTVKEDHNAFKCSLCRKEFRKCRLLADHMKHYHAPGSTDFKSPMVSMASSVKFSPVECASHPLGSGVDTSGDNFQEGNDDGKPSAAADVVEAETALGDVGMDKYSSEIINCICGSREEVGTMLQCESCQCWQHVSCLGLSDDDDCNPQLMSFYVCPICRNPPGVRKGSRFVYDTRWYSKGELPTFNVARSAEADTEMERRARLTRQTHCLMADMLEMRKVVHALSEQIVEARDAAYPYRDRWQVPLPCSSRRPVGDLAARSEIDCAAAPGSDTAPDVNADYGSCAVAVEPGIGRHATRQKGVDRGTKGSRVDFTDASSLDGALFRSCRPDPGGGDVGQSSTPVPSSRQCDGRAFPSASNAALAADTNAAGGCAADCRPTSLVSVSNGDGAISPRRSAMVSDAHYPEAAPPTACARQTAATLTVSAGLERSLDIVDRPSPSEAEDIGRGTHCGDVDGSAISPRQLSGSLFTKDGAGPVSSIGVVDKRSGSRLAVFHRIDGIQDQLFSRLSRLDGQIEKLESETYGGDCPSNPDVHSASLKLSLKSLFHDLDTVHAMSTSM